VGSGEAYVGRAFVVDQWYVAKYSPIFNEQKQVIGMLFVGVKEAVSAQRLADSLKAFNLGKSGFVSIFTSTGEMLVHPTLQGQTALEATDAKGEWYIKTMIDQKEGWQANAIALGDGAARRVNTRFIYFEPRDWHIAVTVIYDEWFASDNQMRMTSIAITAGAVLLQVGLIILLIRRITRPINTIALAAEGIARGELAQSVSTTSEDEIGRMSRAFQHMVKYLQGLAHAAARLAQGDLTVEATPQSDRDVLGSAFAQMAGQLRTVIGNLADNAAHLHTAASTLASVSAQAGSATAQISASIQEVARGASQQSQSATHAVNTVEQIKRAIDGVARGAQEQASSVATASRITSQITQAFARIAENTQTNAEASAETAHTARAGAQTVSETIENMQRIQAQVQQSALKVKEMGNRSQQIGVIVETIDDIASQTNLLALNAAIEAARAGEHGTGFAVVADEVRKLAEKSATATKEIGGLVRAIQSTVKEAVSAMEAGAREVETGVASAQRSNAALTQIVTAVEGVSARAAGALESAQAMRAASNELVNAMDSVSAVVEENTASTEEMAAGSSEMTQAIESIASVSEQNSAAVQQVSATAEEIAAQVETASSAAQALAEMAQQLQTMVSEFKLSADASAAPNAQVEPSVAAGLARAVPTRAAPMKRGGYRNGQTNGHAH
jgi:methyl-accepting chemotaxis protein